MCFVAALFTISSTLAMYLCNESIILGRKACRKLDVIFEILVSSVLLCMISFTYAMTALHLVESSRSVSEDTKKSSTEHINNFRR